jgi:pimeloyl-ACP methyl ester carboxylesterase
MFPPADVTACAERLSETADLHLYTSVEHADDVEEVRRRLGYGPLNVQGGSYGTHAAMVFAQRHPESTRTLFLMGVDSPLRSNLGERSVWTERTLAGLGGVCAGDETCRAMAPDLFGMLAELFAGLEEGPRKVRVADPQDPEKILTVELGRDWLAEQVRLILYYGFTSRALPWAVHRAHAEGDWAPLARLALFIDRFFLSTLADGVQLAVQCSEQMGGFDVDRALARGEATLFGNYRLAQQVQGCDHWPHRKSDYYLGVSRPRPLPIPTVMISGRWDPVTPPAYGEDASAYFPRSRHLILDEGQHGPYDLEGGWACVNGIWAAFLDLGTLEGLDTSCAESLTRQPWLTDGEAFTTYLEGTLAPLIP